MDKCSVHLGDNCDPEKYMKFPGEFAVHVFWCLKTKVDHRNCTPTMLWWRTHWTLQQVIQCKYYMSSQCNSSKIIPIYCTVCFRKTYLYLYLYTNIVTVFLYFYSMIIKWKNSYHQIEPIIFWTCFKAVYKLLSIINRTTFYVIIPWGQ